MWLKSIVLWWAGAGSVAPAPADGDARVAEIGDVVVRDLVVGAVADPDAHRAAVEMSAGADDVVVDDAMPGDVGAGGIVVVPALPDADAAGGQVVDQAVLDAAILAAAAEPDRVAAHVGHLAVFERRCAARRRP